MPIFTVPQIACGCLGQFCEAACKNFNHEPLVVKILHSSLQNSDGSRTASSASPLPLEKYGASFTKAARTPKQVKKKERVA
jgi:hypothetical protein